MESNKSWTNTNNNSNLIGRKRVDWSIFKHGTTIPLDLQEKFDAANDHRSLAKGERVPITLVLNATEYEASLSNVDRKGTASDAYQIRYDNNEALKKVIYSQFRSSYKYIAEQRAEKTGENKKMFIKVPEDRAEYIDFYQTSEPFKYKLKLIPKVKSSVIEMFDKKFNQNQTSYMMVLVLALLDTSDDTGKASLVKVEEAFRLFYLRRAQNGKVIEKPNARMSMAKTLSVSEVKTLIRDNPAKALREFIDFDQGSGIIQFRDDIFSALDWKIKKEIRKTAYKHLYRYYKDIEKNRLTLMELMELPIGFAVSAPDVASVSGQNQMKGIHPIQEGDYKSVVILCTLAGGPYANKWLDTNEEQLKYYLEGRTQADGTKLYNEEAQSNQSVILSKEENYPVHVFAREKKGDLFHYEGPFLQDRVETEASGDKYFVLKANDSKGVGQVLPDVSREQIIEAMMIFDRDMRDTAEWQGWETRGAQKYAVLYEENKYPPKQVISMATGVPVSEFSGGDQSNTYLSKKRFKIEEIDHERYIVKGADVVVKRIHNYIAAKGFVFEEDLIKNFYLSLKTKPFIILAGISGTGKSKIGELFAKAVRATAQNGRYRLIPVRPDWNDSGDLLGYENLRGEFKDGPLIQVIRDAIADPENPYFVCLDEMNLARVEYYFSDFLSIIESRSFEDGKIVSSPIPLNGNKYLYFPENLYVIGTVNMDETTHPFSRKVLDRANTIELTEVTLGILPQLMNEVPPFSRDNDFFKSEYLLLRDCIAGNERYLSEKIALLEQVNKVIQPCGFQVGYRVRDEFCFYMLYNKKWHLLPEDKAVDFQIVIVNENSPFLTEKIPHPM